MAQPSPATDPASNAEQVSQVLWRWLSLEKGLLIAAVVFAAIGCLIQLVPYYILWAGSDALLSGGPQTSSTLKMLAGWLALALVAKYLVLSLAGYLSHKAAFRILFTVRRQLVEQLQKVPLFTLQRYSSAEIKKLLVNDVERVENFVAHNTIDIAAAIVSPVVAGGFLFWLDWRLALCALIPIPLAIVCQMMLYRNSDTRMAEYLQSLSELNSAILDYVKGIRVMKIYGRAGQSFAHLDRTISRYHKLVDGYIDYSVPSWSVFVVLLGANVYFILPVGLWLMTQGGLSVSTLLLVIFLGSGLLKPLLKLTMFSSLFKELQFSVARLVPLLSEQPRTHDSENPGTKTPVASSDGAPAYALKDLSFSIDGASILKGITATIKGPGLYGIVGMSGSGKSTLAGIMAGLMAPSEGSLALFGASFAELAEPERAKRVNIVTQETMLFKGSLRLNLTLGQSAIRDEQIFKALAAVQLKDHVESLAQGIDTDVGELGTTLSGGEKQRIAIARAILADPKVLILDEATAFADALTEQHIYVALQSLFPDKVVISIAHRMSAVKDAEAIFVVEDGRLSAEGRHDELLAHSPLYQELWHSQFKTNAWHLSHQEG